jgi:hypothetical protein
LYPTVRPVEDILLTSRMPAGTEMDFLELLSAANRVRNVAHERAFKAALSIVHT